MNCSSPLVFEHGFASRCFPQDHDGFSQLLLWPVKGIDMITTANRNLCLMDFRSFPGLWEKKRIIVCVCASILTSFPSLNLRTLSIQKRTSFVIGSSLAISWALVLPLLLPTNKHSKISGLTRNGIFWFFVLDGNIYLPWIYEAYCNENVIVPFKLKIKTFLGLTGLAFPWSLERWRKGKRYFIDCYCCAK